MKVQLFFISSKGNILSLSLTHTYTHADTPSRKRVYKGELTILMQVRVPKFSSTKRQLKI